ncbi:MAG: SPOR domain-containing protein [Pseudomonadota bacterium]
MIVDAEYEEIEGTSEELDFAESDSLPWLESDEEDEGAGGVDRTQMIAFLALLAVIGASVIGAVYLISNYNRGPVAVPDGSLIEAPEGPYKTRPDDAGGKQFAGTDDVAPGVGQGRDADGRLADDTGAGSGDQDLNVAMPAIDGSPTLASQTGASAGGAGTSSASAGSGGNDAASSESSAQAASTGASNASADVSGVGVQVGAYSSRARAEQGWRTLRGQSRALANAKRRILEGTIEGSPVFRLQAVAPTLSAAKSLCDALRKDGLDCQVKG